MSAKFVAQFIWDRGSHARVGDPSPQQIAGFMERRSGWIILTIVAITVLLAVPMIAMAPDESASDNPGGRVYDLEDLVDANLPPRVHGAGFIVEAHSGDVLTRAPLLELYRNGEALRQADREGTLNPPGLPEQHYLFSGFDVDRQQPVVGIYTLADAVQEALGSPPLNTDLERAYRRPGQAGPTPRPQQPNHRGDAGLPIREKDG